MPIAIFSQVTDRINADRFEFLLREHQMPVSGHKITLVQRILEAIENGNQNGLTEEKLNQFIAKEICFGRSRTIFVASLATFSARKLLDENFVKELVVEGGIGEDSFNRLREDIEPNGEWSICYMDIFSQDKIVEKIDLCFGRAYYIDIRVSSIEGEITQKRLRADYVWVTILPKDAKLLIKLWGRSGISNEAMATMRQLFDEISTYVQDIFRIKIDKTYSEFKGILYKIFKDLTETAEKPFKVIVDQSKEKIKEFSEYCVQALELPSSLDPIDLPYRVFRLLERALIQHRFEEYKGFFVGKIGVVDRLAFSDQTGAYVNARSGEDGMAVADIYFDTRDTIEEIKLIDRLWVTWFQVNNAPNPKEIETKIEVFNDCYVLHFLYGYTTQEVEQLVFSNIKKYEKVSN